MPKQIRDAFSGLPVCRQTRWQLRQMAKGCCVMCGKVAIPGRSVCPRHAEHQRKRQMEARCSGRGQRMGKIGNVLDLRPGADVV